MIANLKQKFTKTLPSQLDNITHVSFDMNIIVQQYTVFTEKLERNQVHATSFSFKLFKPEIINLILRMLQPIIPVVTITDTVDLTSLTDDAIKESLKYFITNIFKDAKQSRKII